MELVLGAIYKVRAKNFTIALWTGDSFRGVVNGELIDESHWEVGPPFGTANPVARVGNLIVPAPFGNGATIALLDAAEALMYEIKAYEDASWDSRLKLVFEDEAYKFERSSIDRERFANPLSSALAGSSNVEVTSALLGVCSETELAEITRILKE